MHAISQHSNSAVSSILGWIFGVAFLAVGILNVVLVHPVPGVVYLLLAFIYLPPVIALLRRRFGFFIPLVAQIILGIVVVWFTLGVSDLADIVGL